MQLIGGVLDCAASGPQLWPGAEMTGAALMLPELPLASHTQRNGTQRSGGTEHVSDIVKPVLLTGIRVLRKREVTGTWRGATETEAWLRSRGVATSPISCSPLAPFRSS